MSWAVYRNCKTVVRNILKVPRETPIKGCSKILGGMLVRNYVGTLSYDHINLQNISPYYLFKKSAENAHTT